VGGSTIGKTTRTQPAAAALVASPGPAGASGGRHGTGAHGGPGRLRGRLRTRLHRPHRSGGGGEAHLRDVIEPVQPPVPEANPVRLHFRRMQPPPGGPLHAPHLEPIPEVGAQLKPKFEAAGRVAVVGHRHPLVHAVGHDRPPLHHHLPRRVGEGVQPVGQQHHAPAVAGAKGHRRRAERSRRHAHDIAGQHACVAKVKTASVPGRAGGLPRRVGHEKAGVALDHVTEQRHRRTLIPGLAPSIIPAE